MALFRLNNTVLSWNSCSLKINGVPFEGLTAMSFGQKRERPQVYGMRKNGTPLGKVAGKYSCDCQMTFYRDSYDDFTSLLLANPVAAGSYGDAEFTWVLTYFEPNLLVPSPPITVVGTGCTIESEKDTNQEGTDALLTEVEVNVLNILRNGKSLISVARTFSPI